MEGQMGPQYLVPAIEHKIGFDLQLETCVQITGFV